MNFGFTEDQLMIQQMAKDFAEKEIRPNIMDWDESDELVIPIQSIKKAKLDPEWDEALLG